MKDKRTTGSAILFILIGTALLTLITSLTFFITSSQLFGMGYRDDVMIKPISFFISLSFLQVLGTGIGFKGRRPLPMWFGIISILISYILLVIGILDCKGKISMAVMPYATFGSITALVLLLGLLIFAFPSIVRGVKTFFAELPDRIRNSKYDKDIDARNLHNAAEDEINMYKGK